LGVKPLALRRSFQDEMVMKYIEEQDDDEDKRGDSFTVLDI
jgi:hypothetical protein